MLRSFRALQVNFGGILPPRTSNNIAFIKRRRGGARKTFNYVGKTIAAVKVYDWLLQGILGYLNFSQPCLHLQFVPSEISSVGTEREREREKAVSTECEQPWIRKTAVFKRKISSIYFYVFTYVARPGQTRSRLLPDVRPVIVKYVCHQLFRSFRTGGVV